MMMLKPRPECEGFKLPKIVSTTRYSELLVYFALQKGGLVGEGEMIQRF